MYTYVPPNDQIRSQKPNSTAATFCTHEIPSWGLFRSSAGGGICRIESRSRGGVIRLLDNIKNLPLDHAMFLAVSQLRSIQVSPYTCNSRVYAAESKLHM